MKKPINPDTLAMLVGHIRINLKDFDEGKGTSVISAERVMEILTGLMKDGHVIEVNIWPQNEVTQVWEVRIDDIYLCRAGMLLDGTAVPALLKQKKM